MRQKSKVLPGGGLLDVESALVDIIMRMNTKPEQPKDFASHYRRAFTEYGARALWNKRELEALTPADALVAARALRVEGNGEARRLVEQIERACRAAI
jgi:hypothetical protein